MNTFHTLSRVLMAGLGLVLSLGVFVHDARVEQVYTTTSTFASVGGYVEAEQQIPQRPTDDLRTQHAHVDYNPMSSMLAKSLSYQSPSVTPRRDSHHKQLLRTLELGGRHAFDNANLPVVC